eukprot:TRINITY_DN1959_c0_g1_i1.p1 TRINITY_DN1959_c0_g1~~TRINITY_DN1959_c0_g1_i1.p1  ORF type:complete len:269 (-),score=45.06 TRINITY_DN1959_c0_g1_i1:423-1229(-)
MEKDGKTTIDVSELKKLLEEEGKDIQSHYPLTDDVLRRFMISKKYPDRAFSALCNWVKYTNALNWDTPWEMIEEQLRYGWMQISIPLRKAKNGSVILSGESSKHYPSSEKKDAILLTVWLIMEAIQPKVEEQIAGLTIVFNTTGMSWRNFQIDIMYTLAKSIQNCFPIRIKKMIAISANFALKGIWAIVKNWLSEKLRNRVLILSDTNIPEDIMDHEYTEEIVEGNIDIDGMVKHMKKLWQRKKRITRFKEKSIQFTSILVSSFNVFR